MSFLDIKDPEERNVMIIDYHMVKKRLKVRNVKESGDLMNRRRASCCKQQEDGERYR